jgi:hypothetical protein
MQITHGNIPRQVRYKPQFVAFKQTDILVTPNLKIFSYIIPKDKDFLLTSVSVTGQPSGAETVARISITLSPDANIPPVPVPGSPSVMFTTDTTLAQSGAATGAAIQQSLSYIPGGGLYIPKNYIIRGTIGFSAAVAAKYSEFSVIGWLVPAFDMEL